MFVFTPVITPRLQYIVDFIGKKITGKPCRLSSDQNAYEQSDEPRINYSETRITSNELWIRPRSFLFEQGIKEQSIHCFEANGYKAFFKTEGDLPFDIFAACFYLLSRYEEYLPYEKDQYGRYGHENSLAYKENFLQLSLIDKWVEDLKRLLQRSFPLFTIHHSLFTFSPTYDIDEAYSYKHKDWWRTTGAVGKALLKGDWSGIAQRRKVLKGKIADPFDSYEWMDALHQQHHLTPRYFFLVPEKTSKYDRNILPREKAVQQLIKTHADRYEVGIHPSWQSGDNPELLKKEKETLEHISGKKISISRQHFIRLTLPQTYRRLIEAGIQEDFSMGYGSINGFRASVASSFYWYDLEKEETTGLLLSPFCFMEANSFFEQKLSPQQTLEEMRHYFREIKAVNGTFISIWHNTFLGTGTLYQGWREIYEQFIAEHQNK